MSHRPFPLRSALLGAALVLAGGALGYWSKRTPTPPAPPVAPTASAPAAATPIAPASTAPVSSTSDAVPAIGVPSEPVAPLLKGEAAQEAITDLAVTYDAASVPSLARYLAHPEAETRAAARDGLVQLGERAAIPFLQAAAKTAPPDEAKALLEAAEFLALPSWTEVRAARHKQPAPASP